MSMKMVGVGSQYAVAFTNSKKEPLEGSKTYRMHLPANIPAKDFWSPDHQGPALMDARSLYLTANT